MSSDSEDEVYATRTRMFAVTTRGEETGRERGASGEGEDNPLHHTDSDNIVDRNQPLLQEAKSASTHNRTVDDGPTHQMAGDSQTTVVDALSVKAPERTRASSVREGAAGGAEVEPRQQRSLSQPSEHTDTPSSRSDGGSGVHPCSSIPVKTQIDTNDSDGNMVGTECRPEATAESAESAQLPSSPALAHYPEEARRRAREVREKTGQWSRKLTQVHTLTMHTAVARKDNDTPAAVTSLCISRDHRRLYVGDSRGRVFSWTVSDSQGGVMEHWLRDEAVDKCMKCGVEFTFTERKHHCRDCGKIFCHRCSSFESEVKRLRIFKKVRVCEECYKNLRPKT